MAGICWPQGLSILEMYKRELFIFVSVKIFSCAISGPKANDNYGLFSEGKTNSPSLKDFLLNYLTVCGKL